MKKNLKEQHLIQINSSLSTPIYKQIISHILLAIENGELLHGDSLPSVNSLAAEFSIARGSIFKAYNELRTLGSIDSTPGKGYFVLSTKPVSKKNIFLLMSTFNPYREVFYRTFMSSLKNQATVDLYFHHHNINVFETLIENHTSHYNTFIIMPELNKRTKSILQKFSKRNLFILDSGIKEYSKLYAGVYQNYEKDIKEFLRNASEKIETYSRVLLLFSGNMRNYDIVKGFELYFSESSKIAKVIMDTDTFLPEKNDLCLVMDDNDLVRLIQYKNKMKWKLGKDLGIVSFNETPLKSIISDGVTTISPDFEQMATNMANMVLNNEKEFVENPSLLIERKSF